MTNEEFQAAIESLTNERNTLLANQQDNLAQIDQLNARVAELENGEAYAALQTQLNDANDEIGRLNTDLATLQGQLSDASATLSQIHTLSAPPAE